MAGMPFRLLLALLVVSVLACAGPPRPTTETAAPAIQHFFGSQSEEAPAPAAEKPAPAVEASRDATEVVPVAPPAPAPAQEPAPTPEAPPAPEAPQAEAAPQPAEAAPRETPDAIQHFFGEGAVQPEEPAKDQKDRRDVKDGEKVDAFEHFFGEKPPRG
jgi:outer membrane biosynthesis protein TonB